jgi:hypothetical protein
MGSRAAIIFSSTTPASAIQPMVPPSATLGDMLTDSNQQPYKVLTLTRISHKRSVDWVEGIYKNTLKGRLFVA